MSLAAEFAQYFQQLHNQPPFQWQTDLMLHVATSGKWPEGVNAPTGCGKTSVIDIAVFLLAKQWEQKRFPVRYFICSDRRIIVDDTFERAKLIARRLAEEKSKPSVLGDIARTLASIGGTDLPLHVSKLRGGITLTDEWAQNPRQPAIVVTTLDQVGSRLLFRGYGASPGKWPILAGLAGMNSHIFLDEAHLANPLFETLNRIHQHQGVALRQPAQQTTVTALTATPLSCIQDIWSPGNYPEENIKRRTELPKRVELVVASKSNPLEKVFLQQVHEAFDDRQPRSVGCMLNTVPLARRVFRVLREEFSDANVILITGRTRPHEAAKLLAEALPRLRKDQTENSKPLIVVSTQTLEAGADISFDYLVTQLASLPSLIQRFGRLNRFGVLDEAYGAIVIPEAPKDPVYGDLSELKTFLKALPTVDRDFSFKALSKWRNGAPQPPVQHAPSLLYAHAELFAMTRPLPQTRPEPHPYIHGLEPKRPEVYVCWRKELDQLPMEVWGEALGMTPPSPRELLPLPLPTFLRWKTKETDDSVSDAPSGYRVKVKSSDEKVFRFADSGEDGEQSGMVELSEIQPDDVIVLPTSAGGCDEFGWNPYAKTTSDIHDECSKANAELLGGASTYHIRVAQQALSAEAWETILAHPRANIPLDAAFSWFDLPQDQLLAAQKYPPCDEPTGILLTLASPVNTRGKTKAANRPVVELGSHQKGVAAVAMEFSENCLALPDMLQPLCDAALNHDWGKADPRKQADFKMGKSVPDGTLLAKPLKDGKPIFKQTPDGYRHEALSLKIFAQTHGSISKSPAAYLIGTHHGHGRPFLPNVPENPAIVNLPGITVDTTTPHAANLDEWANLVNYMHREFGIWGTAYLEAVLRLADQEQSKREMDNPTSVSETVTMTPCACEQVSETIEADIGLFARHPAEYFACLGLLRRCAEIPELRSVRLHWTADTHRAVLTLPAGLTLSQLCSKIEDHRGAWLNRPDLWFKGTPGIPSTKLTPEQFAAVEGSVDREQSMFLAGYLRPRPSRPEGGFQKQPLFSTIGPQTVNVLAAKLDAFILSGTLEVALMGKGVKLEKCTSFGLFPDNWIPAETHLIQAGEEDNGFVKYGIPWISRLALDSSYFLPMSLAELTLLEDDVAYWPVWSVPLGCAAVFRLLQTYWKLNGTVGDVYKSHPYLVKFESVRKWPVRVPERQHR